MTILALRTISKRPVSSLKPLQALVAQRSVSNTRLNNKPSLSHHTEPTMSNILPPPPPPPKMSFQDIFAASKGEHQGVWKDFWNKGTYHYWDRGQASPSLVDFLQEHPDLFEPSEAPLTALVPGCGRGHDVNLFADLGMQAYGLELAESATIIARDFSETISPPPAPGSRSYITGDFFSNEWLDRLSTKQFDLVYDYTFMVALDPAKGLREQWADRVADLVKPGGILICLEFPLYKAYDLPGPPWAIRSETYVGLLESVGFERVYHIKPRRYLPAGKDSDMISAWRRK